MGALIADAAYFSPVDAHRTAGEGQIPVVIDAGTEKLNHAARDDQIRIGIDRIRVIPAHGDGNMSAVDFRSRAPGVGFMGGIDAVTARVDVQLAAVDEDAGALKPLVGADREGASVDLQERLTMDAVIVRLDLEVTAADEYTPLLIVVFIFRVKPVCPRIQAEAAVQDPDGILGSDCLGVCVNSGQRLRSGSGQRGCRWRRLLSSWNPSGNFHEPTARCPRQALQ